MGNDNRYTLVPGSRGVYYLSKQAMRLESVIGDPAVVFLSGLQSLLEDVAMILPMDKGTLIRPTQTKPLDSLVTYGKSSYTKAFDLLDGSYEVRYTTMDDTQVPKEGNDDTDRFRVLINEKLRIYYDGLIDPYHPDILILVSGNLKALVKRKAKKQ
jgi:hypothetical protein